MGALLSLLFAVISGVSCVNEKYDMSGDNLNLEVTPFQEGLTLPLGETEQIKLAELLKDVDQDVLECINGAYAVRMNDSFDASESLSSLKDMIKIDDVSFSEAFEFSLGDVDVSDIKVEARKYEFTQDFLDSFDIPEITMPSIANNIEVDLGLPAVTTPALDVQPVADRVKVLSLVDGAAVPEANRNDEVISLDKSLYDVDTHFELSGLSVPMEIKLPSEVKSVNDIVLDPNAKLKVSLSLEGSLLASGKVIPDINVNLGSLFDIDGINDNVLRLQDDWTLTEAQGYKNSKEYKIADLSIQSGDWKPAADGLVLDKSFNVPVDGEIIFEDLKTTTNRLSDPANKEVYISLKVEFMNLGITDVEVGIEPVAISETKSVDMNSTISVPEGIEGIGGVKFTETSGIVIDIKSEGLSELRGLEAEMSALTIAFPKTLKVEGAVDNVLTINDVDLVKGYKETVKVTGIDLPAPVGGKISFNEKIEVKAVASAGGNLHSADLSGTSGNSIVIDVKSELEVDDYNISIAGIDSALDIEGQEISVELPESLADLKEIEVYPKGSPEITIDIDFPSVGLEIAPAAEGFTVYFPEMLRFKALPAEYNYAAATNSITFKNTLPESIKLPVEKLVLAPVKADDGKFYARGKFEIGGGVALAAGTLDKAQIDELKNSEKKVSVVANIPEIVPSTVDFDSFEISISENFEFEVLSAEDMPEEIVSVGLIELKDTRINISLNAPELLELGSALTVDLTVDMPDMIKVSGAALDKDGNVVLSGSLDKDGNIKIPSINVDALDLSGLDLKNGIKDVVSIDGTVKLADANVDIDKWTSKKLKIDFNVDITDIDIVRLTGKVDYDVEPVVESVDLSDVAELLGNMGAEANLDFNHAHLALEVLTDLEVCVEADIELVPYYDGKADAGKTIRTSFVLDPSNASTKFWLANKKDRCPGDYSFVEADILGILRNIPEKLELKLTAGTDPEFECVIEPKKDYMLKADYVFELPLEFGEDFEITYKDTIPNLPSIVGSLLSKGSKVKLAGEIVNSLPLGLDLQLNFLDSNGNRVQTADGCCAQSIASCGLDGSASKTELDMVVAVSGSNAADIASLELVFNADSGDATGVPVTDQAYLQAKLQLVLPEGITVDLSEIMNNDEK